MIAFLASLILVCTNPPPAEAALRAVYGAEIDKIECVNKAVNKELKYEEDQEHYGLTDFWAMAPEDRKGDCEDYALTKLGVLTALNVTGVNNSKIVEVVAKSGYGHALLAVQLTDGKVVYLDNRFKFLVSRRQLETAGDTFFDWTGK